MPSSLSNIWVDANGKRTITRIRTGNGGALILASLLAASNADTDAWWQSAEVQNALPVPVAAPYQPAQPYAQLQFICADFTLATLLLPAPQLAIFLADAETVNPANALVTAIVAAAVAAGGLVSGSGSPATGFVAGKLIPYRGAA